MGDHRLAAQVMVSCERSVYLGVEGADIFARHGAREYRVARTDTRETRVHRAPADGMWGNVADMPGDETLTPLFASGAALTLNGLTALLER
ncbi:MAG: hypothetical protein MI723_11850 [Caulobacterales bacterium]|nr:hypothetical protein [Caulobacterales bacterium]